MSDNFRNATSETIQLGKAIYEREIRAQVEPNYHGKMLALDVNSGQYAVGDDSMTAFDRLKAINPAARVYIMRVGYPTAVKIGAGRSVTSS